jgi:ElaB/YqjD/DUF883 family membrane-anchored ribosome-binding protein
MAGRNDEHAENADRGFQRAKTLVAELVDATQSAAEAVLDEQKRRAAERTAGIAEAMRLAAQSLERSEGRHIASYVDRAADRIEYFSGVMRERRWTEILADAQDFARRQPVLFVLGAAAAGFLAGRLLTVSTNRSHATRPASDAAPAPGEVTAVAAAVSSESGSDVFSGQDTR